MIKYTTSFMANDGVAWRIDIATPLYGGTPFTIRGVGQQTCVQAYDPTETDDPFSVYIKSTLTINLYNEGTLDVKEMQTAQIKDFTVSLYRAGVLTWTGYINPKNIQNPMKGTPYAVELSASCGLDMLGQPYVHADLPGTTFEISRCPMNYFRQILFSNLGIILPIRWTNSLVCTAFPDEDVFAGAVQWAADNIGLYSYQSGTDEDLPGPAQSCDYILTGMLQAMGCRIYQAGGTWIIRRVLDLVPGNVRYTQIAGDLGVMVPLSATENLNKHIGRSGYKFILEDGVMTSIQGLKTCIVTYSANIRENILPNGNQDVVHDPTFDLTPVDWGAYTGSEPTEINSVIPGLDGRIGYATELMNTTGDNTFFTLVSEGGSLRADGLPIDTKVLIKRISFGFTFSPTNFPIVPVTEVIVWDSQPLQIQVILNLFSTRYFLNEFGFWVTDEVFINIVVDGMRLDDIAKIDFDKFQGILMPEPINRPVAGDASDLQVLFRVKAGITYQVDNIYITIDNGNDVYESTYVASRNTEVDDREISISSSYSGYMLSNFMTDWSRSDTECNFRDNLVYEGTLTGLLANSIMQYRYKASQIFNGTIYVQNGNWTFNDIYTIDTLGASKFMLMNASYNIEKCQNKIVAIECRNDFISLSEKYYSSNDKPLSN